MQGLFDKVILVCADDDIRLERLLQRNNYTVEHAKSRMAAQMPQDEKVAKSDYVIKNNGTIEELETRVDKALEALMP
jgi:dephospho-CoA kinase